MLGAPTTKKKKDKKKKAVISTNEAVDQNHANAAQVSFVLSLVSILELSCRRNRMGLQVSPHPMEMLTNQALGKRGQTNAARTQQTEIRNHRKQIARRHPRYVLWS
jgi:hypothetical protein